MIRSYDDTDVLPRHAIQTFFFACMYIYLRACYHIVGGLRIIGSTWGPTGPCACSRQTDLAAKNKK